MLELYTTMIDRKILYSSKPYDPHEAHLRRLEHQLAVCPYCKKYVNFTFTDKKYYIIIKCNVCKNIWAEGESIQHETT